MELEAIGIAVEYGAQVLDRSPSGTWQVAGGGDEVPDIRIVGAELQRLGIGVGGVGMTTQAGQSMAHQAERTCIRHAGGARCLRKLVCATEVAPAYRQQNRGVAQ